MKTYPLFKVHVDADAALKRVGALVHALDLGGVPVAEAPGVAAILAGACASVEDDDALLAATLPATAAELTVSVAASMTNAFTELGKAYEAAHPDTKLVFNFAASGPLLAQIVQGVDDIRCLARDNGFAAVEMLASRLESAVAGGSGSQLRRRRQNRSTHSGRERALMTRPMKNERGA